MEIKLRCPQGHVSRWVLGNIVDTFTIYCSECGGSYRVDLLADGSWVVQTETTLKPWDGKEPPNTGISKGVGSNG